MWWFVTTRPCGETKEPEPPLLKRTEAFWTCSSQPSGGSNWYLSLRIFRGGLLNNHIPSSARLRGEAPQASTRATASAAGRKRLGFTGTTSRKGGPGGGAGGARGRLRVIKREPGRDVKEARD